MAVTPYFILSPNVILSLVGLVRGPDKTVPTPAEDWREATVDVVIPALNEEKTIVLSLASVLKQTLRPKRVILIDDGSTDRTLELATAFCEENGVELIAIQRKEPIGKTPTIKRQAREFDSDVEFILDADTVLESENYIERAVQELYQAVGIASACGTILPLRWRDRKAISESDLVKKFIEARPEAGLESKRGLFARVRQGFTDTYRDVLYMFLQRFVYLGQMVFFGTISNPVGCAVAYRRQYVKDLFDTYEPILGDDLTNSEDIFIGFAMTNKGYRNIQLRDVCARSTEPEAQRLPRQIYLWSSSFFQSCYYFNDLLLSPFKSFKRWRHKRASAKNKEIQEKRKIQEPYRQSFGVEYTKRYGRPIGWTLMMSAIEKVAFPSALLIMIGLGWWGPLLITLLLETLFALVILLIVAKGERLAYLAKGVLITPIRYASLLSDLVTMCIFASHLWILRDRRWRK
jgi:glycosyltransferase involved in cell wall biosynthesis